MPQLPTNRATTDSVQSHLDDHNLAIAPAINGVGVRATNTASTSLVNNTATLIPFATEDFDTDGFHDLVTNNGRLTIPAGKGGMYEATAQVSMAANATGDRLVYIYRNGGLVAIQTMKPAAGFEHRMTCATGPLVLAAGDYLECFALQTSGGALALANEVGGNWFSLILA